MTSAIDGLCDIGMASRDLKDSETEAGLTATVIAKDGIAVIVNNDSGVEELTSEQVKDVYTGNITNLGRPYKIIRNKVTVRKKDLVECYQ